MLVGHFILWGEKWGGARAPSAPPVPPPLDGVVYVADWGNSRLLVVPPTTPNGDSNWIESEVGDFQPGSIVATPDGAKVITDTKHRCVQILTPGATCWRRETPWGITYPIGLAFNSRYERWYISDFDSGKIGMYERSSNS